MFKQSGTKRRVNERLNPRSLSIGHSGSYAHNIFNIFGILVVYGIPFLREIPIWGAQTLADAAVKRKLYAVAYLLGLFFLIPAAILTISKFMGY